MSFAGADHGAPRRRSRALSFVTWLAAIAMVAVSLATLVVAPLVRSAANLASGVLAISLQAIAGAVRIPYEMACDRVQHNADVQSLVGEPVSCAPLEEVEWIGQEQNQLEFKFKVTGPKGTADAYVIAETTDASFELARLEVLGTGLEMFELTVQ